MMPLDILKATDLVVGVRHYFKGHRFRNTWLTIIGEALVVPS